MGSHLQLVNVFQAADYPYVIEFDPRERNKIFGKEHFDALSSIPWTAEIGRIQHAAVMTETRDYRMFREGNKIKLYLPSEQAFGDMFIALTWKAPIAYDVRYDFSNMSKRLLKKRLKDTSRTLDHTDLRARFFFQADFSTSTLKIVAHDKPAFFALRKLKPEEQILGIDIL
jgi:hypothetical protein